MEHGTAVVVCASPVEPVAAESIDCSYVEAMGGRGMETFMHQWMPTTRTIQVFALGSGELLGTGAVHSASAACPVERAPDVVNLVLPAPDAVELWATEHISNGEVR
jgi:hypothetical protein